MFGKTKAFSGFSVDNLEKALHFYRELLGLEVEEMKEMPLLHLRISGGIPIVVYAKPNHTPATFTVLNFPVDDIDQAVTTLKEKGINFESYDLEDLKTDENNIVRGYGPSIAWFKDPAGNILSVIEESEKS